MLANAARPRPASSDENDTVDEIGTVGGVDEVDTVDDVDKVDIVDEVCEVNEVEEVDEVDEPRVDEVPHVPSSVEVPSTHTAAPEMTHPGESQSNGLAERAVGMFEDHFRTMKCALEKRLRQ